MHPTFYAILNNKRGGSGGGGGGGGGAVIYLTGNSYGVAVIDPADAECSISFNPDRTVSGLSDIPFSDDFWLSSGSASAYDIQVTRTSGTYSAGSSTTGSWVNLGTAQTWKVSRTTLGSKSCTATFEIRDATTLVVLATATITLTASVNSPGG